MPLINDFQPNTIWKAFALNALTSALVVVLAITIKDRFDNFSTTKKNQKNNNQNNDSVTRQTSWVGVTVTLLFTFVAYYLAYTLMYVIFGFGDHMKM